MIFLYRHKDLAWLKAFWIGYAFTLLYPTF